MCSQDSLTRRLTRIIIWLGLICAIVVIANEIVTARDLKPWTVAAAENRVQVIDTVVEEAHFDSSADAIASVDFVDASLHMRTVDVVAVR